MVWKSNHSTYMVAVLAGGDSAERAVSLASGAQVCRALEAAQHTTEMFDPAVTDLAQIPWTRFDACFIALHGGAGEDGRVQQQLESLGVAYTGSGPAASRLAMSKSASKERFLQAGVPTLPYLLFHAADPLEQIAPKLAALRYPLVIKPDGQGSSLGVGFAHSVEELPERIAESRQYDPFVLAEPWIDGREFTVAILGRRPLPLLEIGTPRGFFDYHAKYESGTTEYRFDTGLSAGTTAEILTAAVGAATSLDTAGLVRVDVMLDRDRRPWVLEVNTIPGLTDHSLAPKAAAHENLDLPALCDWMVRDCLRAEVSR
jgi:D-alanine-D-alanine ligase